MNEKGISFKNYLLQSEWVDADEKIRLFFKVDKNTRILKLSRLRGDEEGPFVYFESYFHPRIGLTGKEDFSRPLYEILEDDYHIVPSLSKERIKARSASPITAKRLKIEKGDAILLRERFVFDPGDRPIEYNIGYYVANKFTYTIDIKR